MGHVTRATLKCAPRLLIAGATGQCSRSFEKLRDKHRRKLSESQNSRAENKSQNETKETKTETNTSTEKTLCSVCWFPFNQTGRFALAQTCSCIKRLLKSAAFGWGGVRLTQTRLLSDDSGSWSSWDRNLLGSAGATALSLRNDGARERVIDVLVRPRVCPT